MTDASDSLLTLDIAQWHADGRAEVFLRRGSTAVHSHVFNPASDSARSKFLTGCRERLTGVQPEDWERLEAALLQRAADRERRSPPGAAGQRDRGRVNLEQARDAASQALLNSMPENVVAQAEAMLADAQLVALIQSDLKEMGVVGEVNLRLALYAVGTSRKLDSPVSGIVLGPSSTGKSYVIEQCARLIPPEDILNATDLTPNALYYGPEDRLVHTLVVAGERSRLKEDERAEATRALREMLSGQVLHKVVPHRTESGQMVTETITRHGPIAFVESTTLTKFFNEDHNRVLPMAADESPEQTRRILEHAARRAAGEPPDLTSVIQRHHALQRLLRRVKVRVPFAEYIAAAMPASRPEARRAIGHTLAVIRSVALLHQRQRHCVSGSLKHGAVIDATLEDYEVARALLVGPMGQLLGSDLTPAVANFGRRVVARHRGSTFTAAQASTADDTIKNHDVASRYLKALVADGVIEVEDLGRGGRPSVFRVCGEVPELGAIWLPTLDVLRKATRDSGSAPVPACRSSGRQLAGGSGNGDPAANSLPALRPATLVANAAAGRQAPASSAGADTLPTSRTTGDQDRWSPADSACAPGQVPADDAASAVARPAQAPGMEEVAQAEAALRQAVEAGNESAIWLSGQELARLVGASMADDIEALYRAKVAGAAA